MATILFFCSWLGLSSISGVWRLLKSLGITRKKGRSYVHSPDPLYIEKLQEIEKAREKAKNEDSKTVFLDMDEFSYYKQPLPAPAYEEAKKTIQPLAKRTYGSDTVTRVVGALEEKTGKLIYISASAIRIATLVNFFKKVSEAYPDAERIYILQDNWPVHVHPDVLVALEPQLSRFERKVPENWPKESCRRAKEKCGGWRLPIQLLPLPTYASWANPIEKVWRKLRQDMLHLHRYAAELEALRLKVNQWLDSFKDGSLELLRYVGLRP